MLSELLEQFEQQPSLEEYLTSPEYFALTTASPLQRAVCRVLDGLPLGDLASHPDVLESLGGPDAVRSLPFKRPLEFILLAGVRCGKSLISACCAVRAARTCDVSKLGAGDIPTVSILSTAVSEAKKTWNHVVGNVMARPALRQYLLAEPTAREMFIRHPSGRPIRIAIAAGSRAASTLVGDWSAGAIFDEAPRMVGEEDGVINLDEARQSLLARMLPGAQILLIGSPWAPFGPVYDLMKEHGGRPTERLVCVRAFAYQLNPVIWTPEACKKLRETDPEVYDVDVMCEFRDVEAGLFSSHELEACARQGVGLLAPEPRIHYNAAIDPATRGNAWTLVVVGYRGPPTPDDPARPSWFVAHYCQWVGESDKPLSPKATFREISKILEGFRLRTLVSDQFAADANQDLAAEFGLWLISETVTAKLKLEMYLGLRAHVADRTVELPSDSLFLRDLAAVRKKVTATGQTIELPRTADGRHADFAPALALAMSRPFRDPDPPGLPEHGTDERARHEAQEAKEAARLAVIERTTVRRRFVGGSSIVRRRN